MSQYITDIKGSRVLVTDLQKAIEQAKTCVDIHRETKAAKEQG